MALSLAIALWGFWSGRRLHGASGPLVLSLAGSVALVAGVIVIYGFPAKQVIGVGTVALIAATLWNLRLRRACEASGPRYHPLG